MIAYTWSRLAFLYWSQSVSDNHCMQVVRLGRIRLPHAQPANVDVAGSSSDQPPYVHAACALWIPEVNFLQPDSLAGIDLSMLSDSRIALECSMCNQVMVD